MWGFQQTLNRENVSDKHPSVLQQAGLGLLGYSMAGCSCTGTAEVDKLVRYLLCLSRCFLSTVLVIIVLVLLCEA